MSAAASPPRELELKLGIAAQDVALLALHPEVIAAQEGPPRRLSMLARYLDTPDAQLAQAGMALRLRRESGQWVQTLKQSEGSQRAFSARGEWETPLPGPDLSWPSLAGTPLGALPHQQALRQALQERFCMRFTRLQWPLSLSEGDAQARVWLCLDLGDIISGRGRARRVEPIREVELELRDGDPRALWRFARRLAQTLTLDPMSASKAARGWALVSGRAAVPRKAPSSSLSPGIAPAPALAAAFSGSLTALEHDVRHAEHDNPEYVHQARVALRRLRTVMRAFATVPLPDPLHRRLKRLAPGLRETGQVLGALRDSDVFLGETLPGLRQELGDAATDWDALRRAAQAERDVAVLAWRNWRDAHWGGVLLDAERLIYEASRKSPGDPIELLRHSQRGAARQLDRVLAAARDLTRLDAPARHQVRIEVKRLRYCCDLWTPLWPASQGKRFRRALAELQDELGQLNDMATAVALAQRLHADADFVARLGEREHNQLRRRLPRVALALAELDLSRRPWQGAQPPEPQAAGHQAADDVVGPESDPAPGP